MNKQWHEKNIMPKNPTLEQKLLWHKEHTKNCACRKPPKSLEKLIKID